MRQNFLKKNVLFRPAGGDMLFWDNDRVTRVNDRTYAVGSNPGICLNKRPDSPPAGRKIPCFFTNMLHCVQHVCEKDKNVPCCRRRIWLPSGEIFRLNAHRVTPVNEGTGCCTSASRPDATMLPPADTPICAWIDISGGTRCCTFLH